MTTALLPTYSLWTRDLKHFLRQRSRVVSRQHDDGADDDGGPIAARLCRQAADDIVCLASLTHDIESRRDRQPWQLEGLRGLALVQRGLQRPEPAWVQRSLRIQKPRRRPLRL